MCWYRDAVALEGASPDSVQRAAARLQHRRSLATQALREWMSSTALEVPLVSELRDAP
ncbi:hypothetical protein HBB16_21050 [Pseudonocardia sp. MCCB 268]|nr:hypothetical protein [Pseudonocardia cytotoxica]